MRAWPAARAWSARARADEILKVRQEAAVGVDLLRGQGEDSLVELGGRGAFQAAQEEAGVGDHLLDVAVARDHGQDHVAPRVGAGGGRYGERFGCRAQSGPARPGGPGGSGGSGGPGGSGRAESGGGPGRARSCRFRHRGETRARTGGPQQLLKLEARHTSGPVGACRSAASGQRLGPRARRRWPFSARHDPSSVMQPPWRRVGSGRRMVGRPDGRAAGWSRGRMVTRLDGHAVGWPRGRMIGRLDGHAAGWWVTGVANMARGYRARRPEDVWSEDMGLPGRPAPASRLGSVALTRSVAWGLFPENRWTGPGPVHSKHS